VKRIAIVGAGDWSRRMHLPVLRRAQSGGNVRCVAVCDLDLAKAQAYAAELDAHAFTDLSAMLAGASPDGLAILVPPAVTPVIIDQCIERGLPFLAEKPPATDSGTHRRLLGKVGRLPHIVAYNRRHAPYVRKALDWMDGAPLQAVACEFSRYDRRDSDFSATSVHGIDTVQCLAREGFAHVRLEIAPAGETTNCFVSGWTASGVRIELRVQPCVGSAREHYVITSRDRTALVHYPQPGMIDQPGKVELHERNRVVESMTAEHFGLAPDDLPALGGILREHELFAEMLEGRAAAWSTLATSLPTQIIRERLAAMIRAGGRRAEEFDMEALG
jgi:predicted dehydrogenase